MRKAILVILAVFLFVLSPFIYFGYVLFKAIEYILWG